MVYVGAIALLFLFIIMMLNLKEEQNKENSIYLSSVEDKSVFLLIIFKFILFIYFICNYTFSHVFSGNIDYNSTWSDIWYYKIKTKNSYNINYLDYSQVNDVLIFKSIYTTYWLHLIIIGFILLVAMIGALILTFSLVNLNNIFFKNFQFIELYSNPNIPLQVNDVFFFSFSLAFIGFFGIISNKRNMLFLLVFSELLFFAISYNFILCSVFFSLPEGQVIALFLTALAAAESVIGLSFLVIFFKLRSNLILDTLTQFRG